MHDTTESDYRIIIAKRDYTLRDKVLKLFKEGWRVTGGLTVNGYGELCQAMVKDANTSESSPPT